ncbi:MAG: hypothetical protein EVB11_00760 [Winogradskyella sp.]|nr:MAG: hypothetical protein EVB11_00760 [Winogradskyella sp.]
MKKTKSLLLAIVGIILITATIMYRKYRRAELRAQQEKIQIEQAREMMEFQRKQDSIERKREYDSLQKIETDKFKKRFDEVEEKREKAKELMKKLQEEIDAKS